MGLKSTVYFLSRITNKKATRFPRKGIKLPIPIKKKVNAPFRLVISKGMKRTNKKAMIRLIPILRTKISRIKPIDGEGLKKNSDSLCNKSSS